MNWVKLIFGMVLGFAMGVGAQSEFLVVSSAIAAGFSSDGNSYFVGYESFNTPGAIGSVVFDSAGDVVRGAAANGRTGLGASVAFNGTQYLMIWEDDQLGSLTNESYHVFGQFFLPDGVAVSTPFDVSGFGVQQDSIRPIASGAGMYLVTYTRVNQGDRYVAGRMVSGDGTVGAEMRISAGTGKAPEVAFDGHQFLVVWCDDQNDSEIRGRFISTSGGLGAEISINASAALSDNPLAIAFDGMNYLVVWNDEVDPLTQDWDVYGQLVAPSGALIGDVVSVHAESGEQLATSVAYDGSHYAVVWSDLQNPTNWNMYARYVNATGVVVGDPIQVTAAEGNEMGGVGFVNGRYLILINKTVVFDEEGNFAGSEGVYGLFVTPEHTEYYADDFDDQLKDPLRWGADILVDDGTEVFLTETNGQVEFSGTDSGIIRPWIGSFGSYTQNWEVAADLHIGDLSFTNSELAIFLAVADATEPSLGDHLTVELILEADDEGVYRYFNTEPAVGDVEIESAPQAGGITTLATSARMRIAFDAATKRLEASCNGIPLAGMEIDEPETSWGMGEASRFMMAIGGSMWGAFSNGTHEVYVDNFELRTGDTLDYLLTVDQGTGDGWIVRGADVAIVADSAPAGYVFDGWIGSTQFLADASASSTTVTMPAHAIWVEATYQLDAIGDGDLFDDDVKDETRWGGDLPFYGQDCALQEMNGRLEFLASAGLGEQAVLRPWIPSVGSYTQSWEVAVDVYLEDLVLTNGGDFCNLNLYVANRADPDPDTGDIMTVALDYFCEWDGEDGVEYERGYEVYTQRNGVELWQPARAYLLTADRSGRLKIAFDAGTKVLTASCNGRALAWLDVSDSATGWAMGDDGAFLIGVAGAMQTQGTPVLSGDAFFDGFSLVGAVDAPADWDGNGLPDSWEIEWFGGIGLVGSGDLCANGVNTMQQAYVAGFDPTDPLAHFAISGIRGNVIEWTAVPGRVYSIYGTTNLLQGFELLEGDWSEGIYTDLFGGVVQECFYRIEVRLP